MSDSQTAALQTSPVEPPPVAETKKDKIKLNRIQYDGRVGQIYGIWLLNFFMKIITIGIYSFWGKTRIRKYIAGCFSLGGDRFEYTGTGMELFKGFLKALPIILLIYIPFVVAQVMAGEEAGWPLIFLLPLVYFIPMAIFMALRYRLSRLTWRGVRGALTGSPGAYANLSIRRMLVNIASFGMFIPYSDIAKHKFIIDHAYFGNVKAEFKGSAKSLMKTHIVTLLLAIPTIGISRTWYRAALARAKVNGMVVGDLRFRNNVTAWDMIKLVIGNLLILILTLGLGTPFVINRNMKFMSAHNAVGGNLDTSQIMQAKDQKITVGEGLDDVMGLDGGFIG